MRRDKRPRRAVRLSSAAVLIAIVATGCGMNDKDSDTVAPPPETGDQGRELINAAIEAIAPVLRREIPDDKWTLLSEDRLSPCDADDNYSFISGMWKSLDTVSTDAYMEIQDILAQQGFEPMSDPPEFGAGFHAKFYNDKGDSIAVTSGPDSGTSYDGSTSCRLIDPTNAGLTP